MLQTQKGDCPVYHVYICDDENEILLQLKNRIHTELEALDIQAEYVLIQDSRELMERIGKETIDLLFLDIDMPYYSGMEIAKYISEKTPQTVLAFVTSHDALVYKTFAYKPFAFIRKSCMDEDLKEFSSRIAKELEHEKRDLVLSKGTQIYRIKIHDIIYLESEGNYINIVTANDTFRFRETMTSMEKELEPRGFIRCHKGYLANARYITRYSGNSLEIMGTDDRKQELPVGRSYEKDVKRKLIASLR